MESFIHLRKGKTPRRLHADLDGLKDDELDDANGDTVACGPDIAVPALVIGNLADDACTPSHTRRLFEAIGHADKEMREIAGANHYYSGPDQRGMLREAVGICTDWLHRHGFSL
jgi:alpha-beta hydrolase superfamily lysophospholipase